MFFLKVLKVPKHKVIESQGYHLKRYEIILWLKSSGMLFQRFFNTRLLFQRYEITLLRISCGLILQRLLYPKVIIFLRYILFSSLMFPLRHHINVLSHWNWQRPWKAILWIVALFCPATQALPLCLTCPVLYATNIKPRTEPNHSLLILQIPSLVINLQLDVGTVHGYT